jgi:hypothetical protein
MRDRRCGTVPHLQIGTEFQSPQLLPPKPEEEPTKQHNEPTNTSETSGHHNRKNCQGLAVTHLEGCLLKECFGDDVVGVFGRVWVTVVVFGYRSLLAKASAYSRHMRKER